MTSIAEAWIADAFLQFRKYKALAEGALAQVDDADFFRTIDPDSNSVALVVKHLANNMRSRWTDFLTTDGEKPDRNRDAEFERDAADTREALRERWETGWALTFAAIQPLRERDLLAEVRIRGQAHTVMQAVHRQLTHYAYHIGQIVLLAKHFAGGRWTSLSIPKGRSKDFEVGKDGTLYRPSA
jgi:Protein of unknown function (DUF1572)